MKNIDTENEDIPENKGEKMNSSLLRRVARVSKSKYGGYSCNMWDVFVVKQSFIVYLKFKYNGCPLFYRVTLFLGDKSAKRI